MFFTQKRLKLYLGSLLLLQLSTCISQIPYIRDGYIDFRSFYTAGAMIRSGHAASLYDLVAERYFQDLLVSLKAAALPMLPPAFAALPFVPLSFLHFWPAYLVFLVANLFVLCLTAQLMRPYLPALSARWKTASLFLFLSFFPAALALMMGQLSIFLLFACCLSFIALKHGYRFLAGALLALALIKFQVAIPVALLFLLWRQWEFFAGFCSAGAVLTAISVSIVGSQNFFAYLRSLYTLSNSITADHISQVSVGIVPGMMPTFFGFFFELSRGAHWGTVASISASALLIVWAARRPPSLPLALTVAVLVSYHLYIYDATVLILPLSLLVERFLHREAVPSTPLSASPIPGASPRLAWKISTTALAALLFSPVMRLLCEINWACLIVLPVLALLLFQQEWSARSESPVAAATPMPSTPQVCCE